MRRCYAAAPLPNKPFTVPLHRLVPARALPARLLPALVFASACPWAAAQAGHAHVHGAVALEISIEASTVTVRLEAPQDSLLGHERTPRTAAEKDAAAALLKRLQGGATLLGLPAERRCVQTAAETEAPQLLPNAKPMQAGAHAEVETTWRFTCASTSALGQLDVGGLLDAFARIQQISAQVAGTSGQHQARLKRPARVLVWAK
jgi:hypothetical protein